MSKSMYSEIINMGNNIMPNKILKYFFQEILVKDITGSDNNDPTVPLNLTDDTKERVFRIFKAVKDCSRVTLPNALEERVENVEKVGRTDAEDPIYSKYELKMARKIY